MNNLMLLCLGFGAIRLRPTLLILVLAPETRQDVPK